MSATTLDTSTTPARRKAFDRELVDLIGRYTDVAAESRAFSLFLAICPLVQSTKADLSFPTVKEMAQVCSIWVERLAKAGLIRLQ